MDNDTIAGQLKLLSKLLEIHGENIFKARSYANAAYQIERLTFPLEEMNTEDILLTKGIGEAIGKKILELLQTGHFPLLEKYLEETPPGILEMLHIKGLGPKKIATIWKDLEIETLGELLYACNENRLTLYKGFGEKTQESIRQSIEFYLASKGRFLYAGIATYALSLEKDLQEQYATEQTSLTGDFRRQAEIIDQLELVTTISHATLQQAFQPPWQVVEESAEHLLIKSPENIHVKFYCCPKDIFAVTLFRTTGHTGFLDGAPFEISAASFSGLEKEEEIFMQVGFPYILPCLRESSGIWQKARDGQLPKLIADEDIRGVIHTHSTWSDGNDSLEKMAVAARDKGYEYLVISDHSRSAFYANGLQADRVRAQQKEIAGLNAKLAPFRIFSSIESDILSDGQLDYPDEILKTFDLVIASVHSNLKMDEQKAMQRLLRAIENPYTTILGHPTGRLLLSRPGYPVDHRLLIDACIHHHVVIEINAHPRRLDLDWRWVSYACENNALLSIDPDAHSIEGFADIHYGVLAAQKGGLDAQHNLSSFSRQELENFLQQCKSKQAIQ